MVLFKDLDANAQEEILNNPEDVFFENAEFECLEKENSKLRTTLDEMAFIYSIKNDELKKYWKTINALIENELKQEKYCNG